MMNQAFCSDKCVFFIFSFWFNSGVLVLFEDDIQRDDNIDIHCSDKNNTLGCNEKSKKLQQVLV